MKRHDSTGPIDGPQLAALRAQAALPFGERANPLSTPDPNAVDAPRRGSTGSMSNAQAAALRAQAATPFCAGTVGQHTAHDQTKSLRVVNETSLRIGTVAHEIGPARHELVVIAKATFDLAMDGSVALRSDGNPLTGDIEHVAGGSLRYPSDFAAFKQRTDVVLHGHAYPPGGKSPAALAAFSLGHPGNRFERRMAVFGERHWQKALLSSSPSAPKPITCMPLIYERAFGGAGFDANPVGVGFQARPGVDGVARLPNMEDPNALVSSPSDTPLPMCFAPLAARWLAPERFDEQWRCSRWPLFPRGFDFGRYQCAPPSQQLSYLRGDEPFACVAMNPHVSRVEGVLPALVTRAFVAWRKRARGQFEELRLRLDTVVFDLDLMTINLLWRGSVEVADAAASEVGSLFVMNEPLGGPRLSLIDARCRWLAPR